MAAWSISSKDSNAVIRIRAINSMVRSEHGVYLNYIDYTGQNTPERVRIVGARTRRAATEFRTLHDGKWMAVSGDWSVEAL